MRDAVLVVLAVVVMEPVSYLTHRFVMHGLGARLHRSHHRPPQAGWEANDGFPAMFATLVIAGMALGYQAEALADLVPIGVGVTVYGAAYALVHDGYIHRRLPFPRRPRALLDRLAAAHRVHHLYGGEPYGMLVPIVPAALRARATATARDPLRPASG